MARSYVVNGAKTNTASTTVPIVNLVGGTTVRTKIYEIVVGSDATPAETQARFVVMRTTARGTQSTSIVANALEPGDPAAVTLADDSWSVNPTITALSHLKTIPLHQRATYRWVCKDGKEIVAPATSGNGLALLCTVVNGVGAWSCPYSVEFEE